MTNTSLNALIADIVERHGGETLWGQLQALDAEISASGFLFKAKHRPVLDHARVRAYAREPRFIFYDLPAPGQNSELIGDDEVRITDAGTRVVESRRHPRRAFRGLSRLFSWDALDFAYFGGYATWNYLVTPFLFLRHGFHFEKITPPKGIDKQWTVLRVTFPDDIPTHSRIQTFYFDGQLLLRRLDYTAEVVGGWAHAAHYCEEYGDFGGLKVPTKRRVYPLPFGSKPLPGPTLVAIEIHAIELIH